MKGPLKNRSCPQILMDGRCGRCRLLLSIFVLLLYYMLFVTIFFTASSKATNLYIILGKLVCVSGHLISFPFFAGIPADWFSALPLHSLPYYRSDCTHVPCVLWKQCVFSIIVPGAVCFYFSSNWRTVHSCQTKNIWKTKSATHQTW